MSMTDCPTGCGRPLPLGKLVCIVCWHQVPVDLQRQVVLTWRNHMKLMRRRPRTADQVRVSRETYEQAKEAALASIK